MNKLIKNARVYKAELPEFDALESHLQEHLFKEAGNLDWQSAGFVEIPATGEIVSTFHGGIAFAVRHDSKILPSSVIRSETDKWAKHLEQTEMRKIGKKERLDIREQVTDKMLAKALTKTAIITCFYDTENQLLIVPVSSKALSDLVVRQLIHAVVSVKTTTINISDVKLGLTTKVREWLNDEDHISLPFGDHFEPGGLVKLVGAEGKAAFDLTELDKAKAGIVEALEKQLAVAELGMLFDEKTSFRLTHDFQLKGITYDYESSDAEDIREEWDADASIQVLELGKLINAMCDLLGYRDPEAAKEAA